jgi:hypothetical protein
VLVQWAKSVIRYGGVAMWIGGEPASGREKGGDNASWTDANLTESKMKKIHAVDLAASNVQWRLKTTMSYFIFLKHM